MTEIRKALMALFKAVCSLVAWAAVGIIMAALVVGVPLALVMCVGWAFRVGWGWAG